MIYLENLFCLWVAYMMVMTLITIICLPLILNKTHYLTPSIKQIGKFQEFHYPKHAYPLGTLDDHYKFGYYTGTYTCPNCGNSHKLIYEHGDAYKCSCGLKTQSFGNGIYFWT